MARCVKEKVRIYEDGRIDCKNLYAHQWLINNSMLMQNGQILGITTPIGIAKFMFCGFIKPKKEKMVFKSLATPKEE